MQSLAFVVLKLRQFILAMLLCILPGTLTASPYAVVVSSHSDIEQLSKRQVIDIFMGRFDRLDSGTQLLPLDFTGGTEYKNEFYLYLVDKNERQIKAYWSRLLFSGRAKPPLEVSSPGEVSEQIRTNPHAIGYLPVELVTEEMKVVFLTE